LDDQLDVEEGLKLPTEMGFEDIRMYIDSMSGNDYPDYFRLHCNAEIKFKKEITK